MFAEKSYFPMTNAHLPPIEKSFRRRTRPPPTPCYSSQTTRSTRIAENVSALKAKYADYTNWLKNTTQPNHEPILTQELLKHSLCRMGIDDGKAERLVSTCSWYVYQFQRDLKIDSGDKDSMHSIETRKPSKNKRNTTLTKDSVEDSTTTTISSLELDDSFQSSSRNKPFALPPVHVSDFSTTSRFRRVDFDIERTKNRTPKSTTRLKALPTEPSNPLLTIDLPIPSSPRAIRRHGLAPLRQARSILRKQTGSTSSNISGETNNRRFLTPLSSAKIDQVPLGTRSQRLFGGSEYFAQIMNELEQQKKNL